VIIGVPLDSAMEFRGNFFTLLRPFPLITGLLGFTAILMQGAVYAALKTEGDLQQDARTAASKLVYAYFIFFAASLAAALIFMPQNMSIIPAWISAAVTVFALFMLRKKISGGEDFQSFVYSSLAFLSLWGIAGSVMFPNLVMATGGNELNITIFNASSGMLTLSIMLGIALVGMPVVIAYSIYVYRVFKGKTTVSS
jgi:cytochrome d ubiquinol oxidase subunit II